MPISLLFSRTNTDDAELVAVDREGVAALADRCSGALSGPKTRVAAVEPTMLAWRLCLPRFLAYVLCLAPPSPPPPIQIHRCPAARGLHHRSDDDVDIEAIGMVGMPGLALT